MTASSFLNLIDGDQVRFDFNAPDAAGASDLGFQVLDADYRPLGGEVSVATSLQGVDTLRQVDSFNAAALSGGGFVVAAQERFTGSGVTGGTQEGLLAVVYDAHGVAQHTFALGVGVGFPDNAQIGAPGLFGLSGDAFALIYERHDVANTFQHLVIAGPGGPEVDVVLPAFVNSISTTGGNLTLGFVGVGGNLLAGGEVNSALMAGPGDDTLIAGSHGDFIRGGDGNDSVLGGAGFDDINGNRGDDTIDGGSGGGDWLVGGQGNDLIIAHSSWNIEYGNLGNDTIIGGTGNDWLRGGQGDDSIVGGSGNNFISGDRGNDTEIGGAGADTFNGFSGIGQDRILDFHLSEGDRIQLEPGTHFTVIQVGADTVIDLGAGDQITLVGVQMSTLPSDFLFLG